jgi:hypothetical protein
MNRLVALMVSISRDSYTLERVGLLQNGIVISDIILYILSLIWVAIKYIFTYSSYLWRGKFNKLFTNCLKREGADENTKFRGHPK